MGAELKGDGRAKTDGRITGEERERNLGHQCWSGEFSPKETTDRKGGE